MKYLYVITSVFLLIVSIGFPNLIALDASDSVKTFMVLLLSMIFYGKYELAELREKLNNDTSRS